ncbi:hypothetical protein ACJX0J_022008, partial [Zea mays]
AICELGSTIGVVEEVDITSLNSKEIVRFKVHVKSVAMIPPIIEVGVKPFLYDIFFKIDNITDEGASLEEFIKDDELIPSPTQEKKKMNTNVSDEGGKNIGVKKGGSMEGDLAEGEMKIADKAATRAMAKD